MIYYPSQPSLFSEDILDAMRQKTTIVKEPHCKSYRDKIKRMGLLRQDVTRDMVKTARGIPTLTAYRGNLPDMVVSWFTPEGKLIPNVWLHGFSEDFMLDRIWLQLERYIRIAKNCLGIFTPDFSTHLEMDGPSVLFNIYRSRAIGQKAQKKGIPVIPTLQWSDISSLDYCIEGLEGGGVYALSNIGSRNDFISRKHFREGFAYCVKELDPHAIVVYGYPLKSEYKYDFEIRYFSNENIRRLRVLNRGGNRL